MFETLKRDRNDRRQWRYFIGGWWYHKDDQWLLWKPQQEAPIPIPPPPPRWLERLALSSAATSGLPALIIGVTAVIVVLAITLAVFGEDAKSLGLVLAPALTAIGAFTGHAAGHAAASQAGQAAASQDQAGCGGT